MMFPNRSCQQLQHRFRFFATTLITCLSLIFAAVLTTPAHAQTFTLRGVSFDDSAYLEDAALQDAAAPYIGRPIGFEDLTQMVAAIQGLYSAAGIITAQVILPPQTLDDGILRISLVEARIDQVEIDGLDRTNPDFLRRTITLVPGQRPDFEQIERDLRIYQLSHDISPKIAFRPGETPGTTTAIISGEEPKPFTFTGSLDNFGQRETGRARATLFARWASVTGVRDTLSFRIQAAEKSKSFVLGYSRPVGTNGGRVVGSLSYSDASVTTSPVNGVTILSDTLSGVLAYRHPIAVTASTAWFFEVGVGSERSKSRVAGVQFSDVSLNEIYGNLSYLLQETGRTFSLNVGLRVGDASALGNTPTEGGYTILNANFSFAKALSDSLLFDVLGRAQVALTDAIPVARLFSAGGVDTVRGYPTNVQSGDSGVSVRLQLAGLEAWQPAGRKLRVTPFAFFDAAYIVPFRAAGANVPRDETLASAGAGLRVQYGPAVSGVALFGVPLSNTTNYKDKGDPTIYVGLDYSF
ncbi:ShlB/FhaC/HecB family hemolysin secretion/activation protein [Roseovarius pelagicus]|uniref:BamA/TamA family outer membrane protein n=1 Tax=Roseovarius pelagicus TaxID=2980108 RepID=A0ABY6DDC5_9RHOB|nr:ShlB/FhaC/HecB family hemolysin secretion/activation protein [Roseovarius pelagicus]UXX84070.1 BamA/TamA family outer membrane protein [Roseovarius pelagicus]